MLFNFLCMLTMFVIHTVYPANDPATPKRATLKPPFPASLVESSLGPTDTCTSIIRESHLIPLEEIVEGEHEPLSPSAGPHYLKAHDSHNYSTGRSKSTASASSSRLGEWNYDLKAYEEMERRKKEKAAKSEPEITSPGITIPKVVSQESNLDSKSSPLASESTPPQTPAAAPLSFRNLQPYRSRRCSYCSPLYINMALIVTLELANLGFNINNQIEQRRIARQQATAIAQLPH